MKRLNFSFPDETRQQLDALARFHGGNLSEVAREAIARYHTQRFPPEEEPSVIGWQQYIPAQSVVCSDLGIAIPVGALAYREIWSDGREGAILSRESMIADGVIENGMRQKN